MKWKAIGAYFHESTAVNKGHCWAICRKHGDEKWNVFDDVKRSLVHQLPPDLANVHTLLYIKVGSVTSEQSSDLNYITYHVEQLSTFVLKDSVTGEGK